VFSVCFDDVGESLALTDALTFGDSGDNPNDLDGEVILFSDLGGAFFSTGPNSRSSSWAHGWQIRTIFEFVNSESNNASSLTQLIRTLISCRRAGGAIVGFEPMPMTDKQIRYWVPKFGDYQNYCADIAERQVNAGRQFKDLVSDLVEYGAVDGDQERILSVYKAEGYAMSRRVYTDIHTAFRSAGAMQNGKATQGRKKAVRKLINGYKGYGKKAMERINEVQEEVDKDRKQAAKKLLLDDIKKHHLTPIGQIMRDNYDVITWDDFFELAKKYVEEWQVAFGPIIEEDKRVDAEVQKKAKGGK
jgi:hypothetical protein